MSETNGTDTNSEATTPGPDEPVAVASVDTGDNSETEASDKEEEEDNDEEDDHDDHTIILNPKPMLELSSLESGRVERRGCNINSYYIIKHQGKKE